MFLVVYGEEIDIIPMLKNEFGIFINWEKENYIWSWEESFFRFIFYFELLSYIV